MSLPERLLNHSLLRKNAHETLCDIFILLAIYSVCTTICDTLDETALLQYLTEQAF